MLNEKYRPVLNWINEGRKVFGLEPLDDIPKGSGVMGCPLNRSFDGAPMLASAGAEYMAFYVGESWTEKVVVEFPPEVYRFVDDFDMGKIPEYSIPPKSLL